MIHRFVLLLLCIGLGGCAPTVLCQKMEPFSVESFETKKKGVVFLALTEETSAFLMGKKLISIPFHVRKFGDVQDLPYVISAAFDPIWSGYSEVNYVSGNMLYLDPGLYYIDYVKLPVKSYGYYKKHRWYPSPGITKKNFIRYGAFFVEAGKVLSLGQISVPGFHHKDDIDTVKSQLSKSKYAYLAPLVSKGTLYKCGSLVSQNRKRIEVIDKRVGKAFINACKQALCLSSRTTKIN